MKIRVGTFNLFQFVEPPYSWYTKKEKFNQEEWLEKCRWIQKQIEIMNCDIIGFQEVFSADALKSLVKELGFNYFVTVDKAKLNKNTYISTTVALASKYPISDITYAKIDVASFKKHKFKGNFSFARLPIKAKVTLPNQKNILVYVAHLKSNRLNEFEYTFNKNHELKHKKEMVKNALKGTSSTSLQQRLCEASSLFVDIKKMKKIPIILLCDFNDKEFSLTIDALSSHKYHHNESKKAPLLYDAYYQHKPKIDNPHPEAKAPQRQATSYFLGRGNVLDYIFISKHFEKFNRNRVAQVTDYSVYDEHLQENRDGSLVKSDHAQVVCELTFLKK